MIWQILIYLILSIVLYASFYAISKFLNKKRVQHPALVAIIVMFFVCGLIGGILISYFAGFNSDAKFLIEHPSYALGTIVGDILGLTLVGWVISLPFRHIYKRKANP